MTPNEDIISKVRRFGLCNKPTLYSTDELCRQMAGRGVRGAFVECGVYAGAQLGIMAYNAMLENERGGMSRRVIGFDSFAGIPRATEEDDETITGLIGPTLATPGDTPVSTGVSAQTERQVRNNLRNWGVLDSRTRLIKGWFEEIMPQTTMLDAMLGEDGIAVLRLDGDLYQATKHCLEALYPRLNAGGAIIIDDYALTGCRRAVDEYFGGEPLVTTDTPGMHKTYPNGITLVKTDPNNPADGVHHGYKPL